MTKAPDPSTAVIRTDLAASRTVLANERTLLAYVRTALAMILTGASSIHLPGLHPNPAFGESFYEILGGSFIGLGVLILVVGYRRYRKMQRDIASEYSVGG